MTNKYPITHRLIKNSMYDNEPIDQNALAIELKQLIKMSESEDISEERLRKFLASASISVEDLAIQTLLDLINDRYTIKQMRDDIC